MTNVFSYFIILNGCKKIIPLSIKFTCNRHTGNLLFDIDFPQQLSD
jgi:hypothetical protein